MRLGLVLFAVGLVCVGGASARQQENAGQAQAAVTAVPRLIQFSGVLKDSALRPVSGAASVTFAIYAEQEGGAALWSETQNVLADANGHYAIVLGAATSGGFPAELFGTGQARVVGRDGGARERDAARDDDERAVCVEVGRCGDAGRIAGGELCDGATACGARCGGCACDDTRRGHGCEWDRAGNYGRG